MTIATATATAVADRLEHLALDQLVPSKTNPRTHFDEGYLDELAGSIRDKGVLQAILVRPIGADRYEIVCGECRYRASLRAGLPTIRATITELTDEQVLEIQLIENVHRRDLTPLEEAAGYRALITANPTKHSAESIARRIGMSPAWVWDRLKLNDLVPEAKQLLAAKRIGVGHAIVIARLKPEDQERVLDPKPINDGRGGNHREGLWRPDHQLRVELRYADTDRADADEVDRYAGLQPVSIRELQNWIDDHIRFDVAHAAQAQPLEFEDVARQVETAEAQPGRGRKVVAITRDLHVQQDARSTDERTFGPRSWKRADGSEATTEVYKGGRYQMLASPTCEHAILGVVVAGEGRGETFDVCIARDRCEVHWKAELAEKRKAEKARTDGTASQSRKARQAADDKRREQEAEARKAQEARWAAFYPALRKAVLAAADQLPAALPKPAFAQLLKYFKLPATTKPAQLQVALFGRAVRNQFYESAYHGYEAHYVAWAKVLGVDVKACEPPAHEKADAASKTSATKHTATRKSGAKKAKKAGR